MRNLILTLVVMVFSVGTWHESILQAQEPKELTNIEKMDPLSKMFLLPTTAIFATPEDVDLDAEAIEFENETDQTLRGWFINCPDAVQTVMVCPGNSANISVFFQYAQILVKGGYNVLLFDYQGFGKSDGIPSFTSLKGDVTAAYEFLVNTREIAPENIGVFGISLGSTLSLYLAANKPIAALALEDVFVPNDMIERYLENEKPSAFMQSMIRTAGKSVLPQVDPIANVGRLENCPLLLLHGENDWLLPPVGSNRVFSAAKKETARLWIMKGVGHAPESIEINDREYSWQLQRFFAEAFGDSKKLTLPAVTWETKKIDELKYQTTVKVKTDSREAIELSLMGERTAYVSVRRFSNSEEAIVVESRFEPRYVSANDCKHVIDNGDGTWTPDLSKMSADRAAFFEFQVQGSLAYRKHRQKLSKEEWSKLDPQLLRWELLEPNLPAAEDVDAHIRPYYASLLARHAYAIKHAPGVPLVSIWEKTLSYFPEVPSEHFRLGNAGFALGYKDYYASYMLERWIVVELQRSEFDKAHQLMRKLAEVHPLEIPLKTSTISDIKTVEQFKIATKPPESSRR